MTQPLSSAQQAQQNNRTDDGKYATKTHSEADVGLDLSRPYFEPHELAGKQFLDDLPSRLQWPQERIRTHERQADPSLLVDAGLPSETTIRSVEFRLSDDPDDGMAVVRQFTLAKDLAADHGMPAFSQGVILHQRNSTPNLVSKRNDTSPQSFHEARSHLQQFLGRPSDQQQSAAFFSDMQDQLHWPAHLTTTDQNTLLTEDEHGNAVEKTIRCAEFTEGGNDEYSDHIYVEQVVEETEHGDGTSVHVQHSVSIRDAEGDFHEEDIFNSDGFDPGQARRIRDHVEELMTDRSNDAEGNSVFYQ